MQHQLRNRIPGPTTLLQQPHPSSWRTGVRGPEPRGEVRKTKHQWQKKKTSFSPVVHVVAVIVWAVKNVSGSFYCSFITRPIIKCSSPESLLVHSYHYANQTPEGVRVFFFWPVICVTDIQLKVNILRLHNYRVRTHRHTHTHRGIVGMMLWHLIMAELCLNCTSLRMCEVSKQQCCAAEKLDLKWGDEGKQREKHLLKTVVVPGRKLDSSGGANFLPNISLQNILTLDFCFCTFIYILNLARGNNLQHHPVKIITVTNRSE